jgi:hypothetical protein
MGWIHNYGKGDLPDEAGAGDLTNFWGMWHDKNWIANELGGSGGYNADELTCLTQLTVDAGYSTNATTDYNGADGYRKYSALANVEIEGGELVGKDVYWAATPAHGTPNMLPNKFDPWTYAYVINVPAGTGSIVFKPVPLSTRITSMKVNGADVAWDKRVTAEPIPGVTVPAAGGTTITVDIVAPDGSTSSTYTFTVNLV